MPLSDEVLANGYILGQLNVVIDERQISHLIYQHELVVRCFSATRSICFIVVRGM